jgi:hypothetical protein
MQYALNPHTIRIQIGYIEFSEALAAPPTAKGPKNWQNKRRPAVGSNRLL